MAQSNQTLRFVKSNNLPIVGDETNTALQKLVAYLNANPNKAVDVRGYYQAGELNTSGYDNLGLARANQLKQKLLQMGANTNQLTPKGIETASLTIQNDTLFNAADFVFDTPKKPSTAPKDLLAKPLNVYFENNTAAIDQTKELNDYLAELKNYIDQTPNSNIAITGFTDNIGTAEDNLRLAKDRATVVQKFMVKKGFNAKQLQVDFKGMQNPIASNETTEGRAKNRRVEIRIQQ